MLFASRRKYFIAKDFQTRFILRFVLTTTIWAAAALFLFMFTVEKRLDEFLYSPHIDMKTALELLMPSFLRTMLLSFILFFILLAYAIRQLSSRLSEPLYSLKKDVGRLSAGDLVSGVTGRDGDEFQELASALDRMRSQLRKKFVSIKEWHQETAACVADLNRAILKRNSAIAQIDALRDATAKLREELNGFTY